MELKKGDTVQFIGSAIRFQGTGNYSTNSFRKIPPGTLFQVTNSVPSSSGGNRPGHFNLGLKILRLPPGLKPRDYHVSHENIEPPWVKPEGGGGYSSEYFEKVDPEIITTSMLTEWL